MCSAERAGRSGQLRGDRTLRVALVVCLVATVALFAATAAAILVFPYALDYGEGMQVDLALRLATTGVMYPASFQEPPYVVVSYPPLYAAALAAVRGLTGLPLLQAGRLISLASALTASACIAAFGSWLGGSRFAGLLAAALFLGNPIVMFWSALARVDCMALALSLCALWLLSHGWQSWYRLGLAVVLVVAAICTRQDYALAVPLAAAGWLWHKDRRRAVVFAAAVAGASLGVFAWLNHVSRGGFWLHVVQSNTYGFQFARVASHGGLLLLLWPVVAAMAGLEITVGLRKGPGEQAGSSAQSIRPFLLWALLPYTLGALLPALLVGKSGSNVNYFLQVMVALSIWATLGFVSQPRRGRIRQGALAVMLICQLLWTPLVGREIQWHIVSEWQKLEGYRELAARVADAVKSGPVLADEHLELVVAAGQSIYLQPQEFELLRRTGKWDPTGVVGEVNARKFPLMVLSTGSNLFADRWAPEMLAAIEANYCGVEVIPGLTVYTPAN